MSDTPEENTLKLLSELQKELTTALNSLAGRKSSTISDLYVLFIGRHINRAADGFLLLRAQGRADASKLLIRPAIEAMIRLQALRKDPQIFYQIAYSERLEDHKWFRPAAQNQGQSYGKDPDPPGWCKFEAAFRAEFPKTPLVQKKLPLWAAATIAGLEDYYNSHYRLYCQYTHAALRAIGGSSDDLSDPEDARAMTLCAFAALSGIVSLGAESKNFAVLHERVDEQSKTVPPRLKRMPAPTRRI